jgi:hypothetical protein
MDARLADLHRMHDALTALVATCTLPRRDRGYALLQAPA